MVLSAFLSSVVAGIVVGLASWGRSGEPMSLGLSGRLLHEPGRPQIVAPVSTTGLSTLMYTTIRVQACLPYLSSFWAGHEGSISCGG